MRFEITYDPRYGYSYLIRDYRGSVFARPSSVDYWSHKEEVLREIQHIKEWVFHAAIRDTTPAKHKAPGLSP